jgi:hypothetical protein
LAAPVLPCPGFYHAEYNTDNRPKVLKRALERAVDKGWLNQVRFLHSLASPFPPARYLARASPAPSG